MTNNPITELDDLTAAIIAANERRLADIRATPAPIMPDRPTDTSRNGLRTFRRSPKRRAIR